MASGARSALERPLVFVHLPRTGGTTLTLIVTRQFPAALSFAFDGADMDGSLARYRALPENRRRALRLISGHVPFGIHEIVGPADYVTMLRDPVERVISMYEYILRRPAHFLHDRVVGMDLGEYVETGIHRDARNGQCRLLSGEPHEEAASASGVDLLERAWRNLESFVAVGLTERFDESLLLYRDRLGWDRLSYGRENVLAGRPSAATFPTEVLDVVRRHNALDLELYARVRARFNEAFATVPDHDRQLQELRRSIILRQQWWGHRGRLSDLRWDARRWLSRWRGVKQSGNTGGPRR
jgi:hypothetical protein